MRIAPRTLRDAARAAGAAGRVDPDTQQPADDRLYHCGRPMLTTPDADGQVVRYACATCGTDITHLDGHGAPAPITPQQRRAMTSTGELWTVGQDTSAPLTRRGAAGTGQHAITPLLPVAAACATTHSDWPSALVIIAILAAATTWHYINRRYKDRP